MIDSSSVIVGSLMLPGADDTIAALGTPVGRSAIAVIRVSGPAAHDIASRILRPWRAAPGQTYLAVLRDPVTGGLLDHSVVTVYSRPRSYTGEDLVEVSVHGGHIIPVLALSAIVAAGAREALPGEFTRRAVMNGKLDLLQAEAVGDLIDARSRAMHEAALAQLDGALSHRVAALRDSLLELEALIAYEIDFPEEDDGPVPATRVAAGCSIVLRALDALLETAATGEVVREGAIVVIAGAPNTGKSSLFNAVLGVSRALVTDVPGTTRDALEAVLEVRRWPVRLIDTAGLRETADVVERLGIEVCERWLARADIILACGEDDESLTRTIQQVRAISQARVIAVRTKSDLISTDNGRPKSPGVDGSDRDSTALRQADVVSTDRDPVEGVVRESTDGSFSAVHVSAITGAGLGGLLRRLDDLLTAAHGGVAPDVPLLTRGRHQRAVEAARDEVIQFGDAWRERAVPAVVAAVHLRTAAAELESLIGSVDVDDVLDRVFSTFCVGK